MPVPVVAVGMHYSSFAEAPLRVNSVTQSGVLAQDELCYMRSTNQFHMDSVLIRLQLNFCLAQVKLDNFYSTISYLLCLRSENS